MPLIISGMKHAGLHTLTFALSAGADPLRVEGIAYSGGVVPAYGWHGDIAIDLSGLQNDGAELPLLADHQQSIESIAGRARIQRVQLDGEAALTISGTVTETTPAGQQIAALLREGFPLQMSVGISANFREVTEPITVNGQSLKVQGVFENPLVREVSFVPVGADPATSVAAFAFAADFQPAPAKESTTMSRSQEDEALIAGLKQQVEALKSEIERTRTERRAEQLAALMTEIGRDAPQGDALKPYLSMSDEAFSAFAADLRAVAAAARVKPDAALFSSQAVKRAEKQPADADRASVLLSAVKRLSATPSTI